MTERNRQKMNLWVAIGAVVLIILLLGWLYVAFLAGDTDVAASIFNPLFGEDIALCTI